MHEKEETLAKYHNMHESHRHNNEPKKPDTNMYVLCYFLK